MGKEKAVDVAYLNFSVNPCTLSLISSDKLTFVWVRYVYHEMD